MRITWLAALLLCCSVAGAQDADRCGTARVLQQLAQKNPAYTDTIERVREGVSLNRAAYKTTAIADAVVIPVVFHIVLNEAQLKAIGGEAGVMQRIDSQMAVINRDFQGMNADSVDIPAGFKPLFGKTNITFALAHTAPGGSATPGYEIVVAKNNGVQVEGGYGSGFGFSAAKYAAGGGADAWEPESYINVWVINTLDGNSGSNILGLAIPPYLTKGDDLPLAERGITLNYGAFGKRKAALDVYAKNSDGGRTLTHELGHFFELFHIWGDDDGKCPWTNGKDDGINDTPPQSYPSSGCFVYPKFDGCTKDGNGIMFMNYMDYSSDACAHMFSTQQAARMTRSVQPGNDAYGLTQHPWLTSYPDAVNPLQGKEYVVYPNPADEVVNVVFRKASVDLKSIHMVDVMGRYVAGKNYDVQTAWYSFDVSHMAAGIFLMVLDFGSGKQVHKVLVR